MGCHQAAWNTTPSFGGSVPDHIKASFPSTAAACAQCHTITKWADGKFDHTAFGFPLTNSHALVANGGKVARSEEHTSELQSRLHLVCRLLLEKKKRYSHTI